METYEFAEMLRGHSWSFEAKSFYSFFGALKQERIFERMASSHPHLTREFAYAQRNAVHKLIAQAKAEQMQEFQSRLELYKTGDQEFDEFRDAVMRHDYYYQYSDDGSVYRAGNAQREKIIGKVKEKGGLYEAFWIYYQKTLAEQSANYIKKQREEKRNAQ